MGKGTRQQCVGTLKNGQRCTKKAHKDSRYCGTVSHQAQAPKPEVVPAPAAATPIAPSLEYADIADRCMKEMKKAAKESPGVAVQWMRLALDAVRSLKDELRILEAQYITYHITYADPLLPLDDVPLMPELPEAEPD